MLHSLEYPFSLKSRLLLHKTSSVLPGFQPTEVGMLRERSSSILHMHEQMLGTKIRAVEVHRERTSPVRDSWECEQFELLPPSGGFATRQRPTLPRSARCAGRGRPPAAPTEEATGKATRNSARNRPLIPGWPLPREPRVPLGWFAQGGTSPVGRNSKQNLQ